MVWFCFVLIHGRSELCYTDIKIGKINKPICIDYGRLQFSQTEGHLLELLESSQNISLIEHKYISSTAFFVLFVCFSRFDLMNITFSFN